MSLFVHPESKHILEVSAAARPHALLLTGPHGIGLATIAHAFFGASKEHLVTVLPERNEKIDTEKGTITVESIRRLYDTVRTHQPNGRLVLVDYAERMAVPAQNAFLKLLEEPSEGTRFILLTHQPELLLATITSRVQRIDLRYIAHEQSNALLDDLKVNDATKRTQLLFIADGLPAELTRLAQDESYFEARATLLKDARLFLTGDPYQRLLLAKKYKDDRWSALTLLEDAMKLLKRTLASNGDLTTLKRLERLEVLHERLTKQGNVRLQLSAAVMV